MCFRCSSSRISSADKQMPRAKQKNCTGSSAGIPGVMVGDEGARYAGGVVEPVAGVDWTRRYSARGSSSSATKDCVGIEVSNYGNTKHFWKT